MDQLFYETTMSTAGNQNHHNASTFSVITNRSQEVIRWSDSIAQITRQTDRNLSSNH
jgi:hypothetical protein